MTCRLVGLVSWKMLTQNSKKSSRYVQTLMIRDSGEVSGPAKHFQIRRRPHRGRFDSNFSQIFQSNARFELLYWGGSRVNIRPGNRATLGHLRTYFYYCRIVGLVPVIRGWVATVFCVARTHLARPDLGSHAHVRALQFFGGCTSHPHPHLCTKYHKHFTL